MLTEAAKALLYLGLKKPVSVVCCLYKMNKWQNYQNYNASISVKGTQLQVEFVPSSSGKKQSLISILIA